MTRNIKDELRGYWSQVLEQSDIDDGADFFELGGSSIKAVQIAALVQEHLGLPLDAVEVVVTPSFAALAEILASRAADRLSAT
jgi:acyl carrier protein